MYSLPPRLYKTLVLAALLLPLGQGTATLADSREVLAGPSREDPSPPAHVALLMDTSAAAAQSLPLRAGYDPATASTYLAATGCDAGRVYWRRDAGVPPDCRSAPSIARTELVCDAAVQALDAKGYWVGRGLAQWSSVDGTPRWRTPEVTTAAPLECQADRGLHGTTAGRWYARNGDGVRRWSAQAADEIDWQENGLDDVYVLYDGRYLAWWQAMPAGEARPASTALLRGAIEFAHALGTTTLSTLRYSHDAADGSDAAADGGIVVMAPMLAAEAATALPLEPALATMGGGAPVTEALFEATRFLAGQSVMLGIDSHVAPGRPWPSVSAARRRDDTSRYASPIVHACQRTALAALLAAEPSQDASAPALLPTLPDFIDLVGRGCDGSGEGHCLDELARYLSRADLRAELPGAQRADTVWTRLDPFARDVTWPAVERSTHGTALRTADADLLGPWLTGVAHERITRTPNSAPVTPLVTGATLIDGEDLFVATIEPAITQRWRGNVRRYRAAPVAAGSPDWQILDRSGQQVLDTTSGGIRTDAMSLWSRTVDAALLDGGAAAALPAPDRRQLFTDLAGPTLTAPANRLQVENPGLTPMALGLTADERTRRDQTLRWLLGIDTEDVDRDGNVDEARQDLGATAQAAMVVVRYDRSRDEGLLFVPTTDGLLHALDVASGVERWAYVPGELLPRLDLLRRNPDAGLPASGLGGEMVSWQVDADHDGRLRAGTRDQALLFFGLGQSGRTWYALDVIDPAQPRLLWRLTPAELPGLGQTWSRPVLTQVALAGVGAPASRLVVVLAGGFDPGEAREAARTADVEGNRLYIVDALDGRRLWYAGGPGPGTPDLPLAAMTHAIVATPRVLDLDGDQRADRIYLADLGGRVWRFDLQNGAAPAGFARAGVIADLGNGGSTADADRRQFYFEPDISAVPRGATRPYLALSLASGALPQSLSRRTADRLYSIRDYHPAPLTALEWAALPVIREAALTDVTAGDVALPSTAAGWRRSLTDAGEKAFGAARTIDFRVYLPTYLPPERADSADCLRVPGRHRLYALDLRTGRPVPFRVDESPEDPEPLELMGPQLPRSLSLLLPQAPADCRGAACRPRPLALLGTEAIDIGFENRAVRSVWAEREPR